MSSEDRRHCFYGTSMLTARDTAPLFLQRRNEHNLHNGVSSAHGWWVPRSTLQLHRPHMGHTGSDARGGECAPLVVPAKGPYPCSRRKAIKAIPTAHSPAKTSKVTWIHTYHHHEHRHTRTHTQPKSLSCLYIYSCPVHLIAFFFDFGC